MDGLSYAEQQELAQKLERKREQVARDLMRSSTAAWKKLRYPPAEVEAKIADPTNPLTRRIWEMQVNLGVSLRVTPSCDLGPDIGVSTVQVIMARTLMIATILQRSKIG